MIELQKTPRAVIEYFKALAADEGKWLLLASTDLGKDLLPREVWVLLTEDKLFVAEGVVAVTRAGRGQGKSTSCFKEAALDTYDVGAVKRLRMEEQIFGGMLTCLYNDKVTLLFNYTGGSKHDVRLLRDAVEGLQKDGKIDEKRLKAEIGELPYCPKCGRRYPDPHNRECGFCTDKKGMTKKLSYFFLRYKGYMAMIVLTIALVTGIGLVVPQISSKMYYNDVLTEGGAHYGRLWYVVGLIVAVRFASLVVSGIHAVISARVAARVTYDLKSTIYRAISRLSLGFFASRQTGGLMTQINNDSNTIYFFFCDGFPYLLTNAVKLIGVLIIMLMANPLLTLYTFITVPIFFFVYRSVFTMFEKLHARSYSKRRSMNSLISDVLNGMRVVKAFSGEGLEKRRFGARSEAVADAATEVSVTASRTFPLLGFLLQAGSFVVWAVGGKQVMESSGSMNYGDLMAFVAYTSMVYAPIDFFADVANWWTECTNALKRLFEINDASPDVAESPTAQSPDDIKGDVEFDGVYFAYDEGRDIIKNVSFSVPHGTTLGIVGHTGAGKSTLANLLTRLYDPQRGTVRIDGIDLKELSFKSLHGNIAIVSQETYLFRGTIMDNIRYARPSATEEEVIAAAKAASAHDFIIKYPDGYQTMVGLGSKELSGGEKQRVSIARALLADPRILILDEATAAMDTQTERQIQAALDSITHGRTTIIIAHRLSTLRNADKLIVIENGAVAESGTAEELLKAKGVYFKLYKLQAEALKTVGVE